MRQTGRLRGPVTPLPQLDHELGGAFPPGLHLLHLLHAGPGAGKTALARQIAAACGFAVRYVTAGMRPLELLRRHTAGVTGITGAFLGCFKNGELPPGEALALARRAAAAAPQLVFAGAATAFAAPPWRRDAGLAAPADGRHLLVVIDSAFSFRWGARNWAETLRRRAGTLLENSGIEPESANPQRTRARLEKALTRLQTDGVIAGWAYEVSPGTLPARSWFIQWQNRVITIQPPVGIAEHYRALKPAAAVSAHAAARRTRTIAAPGEPPATSQAPAP